MKEVWTSMNGDQLTEWRKDVQSQIFEVRLAQARQRSDRRQLGAN
jgi:hypothetical protein